MNRLAGLLIGFILCLFDLQAQDVAVADSLFYAEEYEAAFTAYNKIIEQKKITPLELGNSYLRRGRIYNTRQNYKLSLQDYFTALQQFEQIKNEARIAAAYNNIGDTYSQILQYSNASIYIQKSLELYIKLKDTIGIIRQQNSIGMVRLFTTDTITAKKDFLRTINEFSSSSEEHIFAKLYQNLAICYRESNSDSALFYYTKALDNATVNEDSATMAIIFNNIGDLELGKGNFNKALGLFRQSDRLNRVYGDSTLQSIIYHNLSLVYDTLKDYGRAYQYATKERRYNDALYDKEKNKIAAELSEKYESDKKDAEITSQQKQNKLKSRNLLLSLIALGLVGVLGIVSFINYRKKQNANKKLQQQNQYILSLNKKLDESNQVKTKLFSIISHDLRSPVSSLFAYLQFQQHTGKSPIAEATATVTRQTENLLETLEDLLMWSKSQLEQFTPEYSNLTLYQSVAGAQQLCITDSDIKKLVFTNEIPQDISMFTDANMFTVVIRNIIANAVQNAIPETAIVIKYEHTGKYHCIIVQNLTAQPEKDLMLTLNSDLINSKKHGLGRILIQEFTEKLQGTITYGVDSNLVITKLKLPL